MARSAAVAAGLCLSAALSPATARAEPPVLGLPVDCRLGESCHIQHYVDRDPSPDAADHTCGSLTYDGHTGTDFRLADEAAMRAGVAVLAAASGTVTGTRDAMPDIARGTPGAPDVAGRECGNGVVIRHPGGWSTQYCHLARGSVAVSSGDTVAAGQPIGRIGLSGATEFPHLHFTLRNDQGAVVDPFDGRLMQHLCTLGTREGLWADPPPYAGGGALAAGFADRVPDYAEVKAGRAAAETLPAGAPALVFWAHFYGLRPGDVIALRLTGPDGATLVEDAHVMDRVRAQQFRAAGRRARGAWAPGRYAGEARLLRGEAVVARIGTEIEIVEKDR